MVVDLVITAQKPYIVIKGVMIGQGVGNCPNFVTSFMHNPFGKKGKGCMGVERFEGTTLS